MMQLQASLQPYRHKYAKQRGMHKLAIRARYCIILDISFPHSLGF
jgi:hypothetical protein